jgi:peptidoglycan endopeptidase LytE
MMRPNYKLLLLTAVFLLFSAGQAGATTGTEYVVQAGDTLWAIAEQNGVTVDDVMQVNGLTSEDLYIGQVLQVEASSAPNTYTVQPGENLTEIAARFGFTLPQLLAINNLPTDLVDAGTVLVVIDRLNSQVSRSGSVAQVRQLLAYAGQYIGTPYRAGGSGPGGFDCSGFASYVFKSVNIQLPRTAASQYGVGTPVEKSQLQPGDLVFFAGGGTYIDHVGIYTGNGQFIHSSSPRSGGVIYTPLEDGSYYSRTYAGARRVF